MFEIPLRNWAGETVATTIVDSLDYVAVGDLRWCLHRSDTKVYAKRNVGPRGQQRTVFMHRVVADLPDGDPRQVDHINGDTLDNRRANLRIVTPSGNAQNQGSRGGSSRFRGVTWDKSRGKWLAHAQLDGRKVTIGRFASEDEAGRAAAAWRAEHMEFSPEAAA